MGGEYSLTELEGGHSGAESYRIRQDGQDFMLKIFPRDFNSNRVLMIPEVCQLYQQLNIGSLRHLKTGYLSATDQYFCIYNYIDGYNMEIIGENEYSEMENYRLGRQVGNWLWHLKQAPWAGASDIEEFNVEKTTLKASRLYTELIFDVALRELLLRYFSDSELSWIHDKFIQTATAFDGLGKNLIHGDIKRSNIMRDHAGNLYLIDIESLKYGHDMMNFRHQMTWLLQKDKPKRWHFLRGVFDGLYSDRRPAGFNNQLSYTYILNFIEHVHHMRDKSADLETYLHMIRLNLPLILNATEGGII